LLLFGGDIGGVGNIVYVSDTKFLWEDMYKYVGHCEIFIGISVPQDSATGMTNIIDIFEQLFDQDIV
jgi:hypothetical protein